MLGRGLWLGALLLALAGIAAAHPPAAAAQLDLCLEADAPPLTAPPKALRFGITPQLAGTVGGAQGDVAPEDPAQALAALHRLEPPKRRLVVRLNRLFMSDGHPGIDRFVALADSYAREGFAVESQIRYHPAPEQEGDMAAWERYVRDATAALGRNPALVALTITNEVNLPISENTSDGAYAGALDAIVRGVVAAREKLDALGRSDVALGFSYAYRYLPDQDMAFWQGIGQRATPEFHAALDYVGAQLYPGLFWPPAFAPGETAGSATIEALTLLRHCWMPQAGLDEDVDIWVTENGYATNLNRPLDRQVRDLASTVEDVYAYSGTLNVPEFRYFNLRDNRSQGSDLFDAVGLLFDDYAEKPAFATYRDLVERFGFDDVGEPRLKFRVRCSGGALRARVVGPDSGLVARVRFLVSGAGRRAIAHDRRRPFRRVLPGSAFGDDVHWRAVAAIRFVDGEHTKLRRSKRMCR
jgi:hypothetical protein